MAGGKMFSRKPLTKEYVMISGIGSSGLSQSMAAMGSSASRPDPAQMAKELFASTDSDGSGAITQEELTTALASKARDGGGPDAEELFAAMDSDGDGQVTEEEHESGLAALHRDLAQASMLTSMGMNGGQPSMADQLFTETDVDNDGSITKEELTAAIAAKNKATGGDMDAEELFAALDADADGSITQEEHRAGLESMSAGQAGAPMGGGHRPPPPEESAEETFDAADTNEDGVVDLEELIAAVAEKNKATGAAVDPEKVFEAMDADTDGSVTQDEFSKGLEAMRQSQGSASSTSQGSLSQTLMAAKYDMYRLMGMDAQNYMSGGVFSMTA